MYRLRPATTTLGSVTELSNDRNERHFAVAIELKVGKIELERHEKVVFGALDALDTHLCRQQVAIGTVRDRQRKADKEHSCEKVLESHIAVI